MEKNQPPTPKEPSMEVKHTWSNKYICNGDIVSGPDAKSSGIPVLSPVRTSVDNTCCYRSLCDLWDAQARIHERAPLNSRFSVKGMLKYESKWLNPNPTPLHKPRAHHCLDYFYNKGDGLPLPMVPERDLKYRIKKFEVRENKGSEIIELVKERLVDGPLMGSHRLCLDYFESRSVYVAKGAPYSEDNKQMVAHLKPQRVEDPVSTPTPPSSPNKEEKEEEAKAIAATKKDKKKIPPQRKDSAITAHAVCIVGYGSKKGQDFFIVQDSQGTNFQHKGFNLVSAEAFLKFFFVDIEPIPSSI